MTVGVSRCSVSATRWMTNELRLHFWQGKEIFLFPKESGPALGSTQPPFQWVQGALSPGLKWPGIQSNHTYTAVAANVWSCNSTPPVCLHGLQRSDLNR